MQKTEKIDHFYQSAVDMLAQPASNDVPETSLYHPLAAPDLLVHVGSVSNIPDLRRQLPDNSFLLSLHDPAETITDSYCCGRTLIHPIEEPEDCARRIATLINLLPGKKVQVITDETYRECFASACESIERAVNIALSNATNDHRRGMIRLRAGCTNMHQMVNGPRVRPNQVSEHIPVILCGAGPSLARHLDELKTLRGRVAIAAVGHAVQTLDQAGITPDVIFESDPTAGRNWPKDLKPDTVMVASIEVADEVVQRFKRVCWSTGSSVVLNAVIERYDFPLAKLTLGRTISVPAIDFLQRMGFRHVALLGQDYCLDTNGNVYAEGSDKYGIDPLFELPSAVGEGTVSTNASLLMLHEAVNDYFNHITAEKPDLRLVNVSGGARLECTTTMTLSDWITTLETVPVPDLFSDEPQLSSSSMYTSTLHEVKQSIKVLDNIMKQCESLSNELDYEPVRLEIVKSKQKAFEEAIERERLMREQAGCAPMLHTLFQHADHTMKDTPGMMSKDHSPNVQLNYLYRRYGLVKRLCEDVQASLSSGADPHLFSAFLYENRKALERANPEFAKQVMQFVNTEQSDFSIRIFNQVIPYVKRKIDEEWHELSGFSSIYKEAAEVVGRFIEEHDFKPQNDALTIIAPGNWAYVLEFLRRFPLMELAVIEPWPELLGQILTQGSFLHQLPERTVIAPTWADPLYMKRRGEWNTVGMRKLLFVSPHVAEMSDVAALVRNMEMLP